MPKIIIHNAETNEIIEREMNDKELQDYNAREAEALAALEAEAQKAAAKQALLDKLGITADEAQLLLGGN
jgi:hypothetical protein